LARDWVLRLSSDGTAVLYHPFSGDLIALSELAALVALQAGSRPSLLSEICEVSLERYTDEDQSALCDEVQKHIAALAELGAIATLATDTRC
jgi:hypothetical protein